MPALFLTNADDAADRAAPSAATTRATPPAAVLALDASPALPRVSAATARGLSHAYGATAAVPIALGNEAYAVRWRVDAEPAADAHAYRFVVGPATGTLWLDPLAETEWLGDAADPAVPAVIRAALLADLGAPLAATLQAATRQRVELLPPAEPAPAWHASPAALRFELRRADGAWRCHGALLFDAPDALAVFFASAPAAPPDAAALYANLPVPLAFELGRTALTAAELADVVAGDIIAIEHWRAHEQDLLCVAYVRAAPAWEITGRPAGNRLTVQRIREMPLEPPRTDSASAAAPDAPPADAPRSLDGLAVDLRFELPPTSMPLGELGTLQPGAVIELPHGINQSVIHLVANGMLIGTGQLIAVGQKLGVRVVTLTPPTPRER
ncbi:TPA: type III secretion system cytoplasmic ring protein SctQ [Burkholderia multivorans]|uniref:type III secretion system cytoplasmic ring protein SctQ n=1 Tax=Burkholderia multivorans TaxID=87883 RepID=UPI000CFFBDDA|nr:type III secretion system cytoplasmic ring protein SctQ [Burkholderia multivorans]MBU9296219.1 type III secretion system cytoplasmic ring protein SctQ [Burkholderia multivorans]MBU9302442.1 type III secretion system cytoplasmic ring protein SctQ [Burkholderia multivorans]MBU9407011.1 type III secretion system cytoplasmic ring protein SctQ [Burkholderia multivorans]MBU9498777.1 type III secretion system cytoplasmic ring protein SctQ [Burkholderia multivorans]MBU9508237.1 type III secretion s